MDKSISRAEELARIGRNNELAELEYEDSDVRIHLTFEAPTPQATNSFDPALLAAVAGSQQSTHPPVAPATTSISQAPSSKDTINSPLAGVFYRSPSPTAGSFVEAGDQASAGQTLCIVEAMKLMNEIAAERACKVVEILVENGEAVEEGQPLFVIA